MENIFALVQTGTRRNDEGASLQVWVRQTPGWSPGCNRKCAQTQPRSPGSTVVARRQSQSKHLGSRPGKDFAKCFCCRKTTTGTNSGLKTPALKVTRRKELPIPQYAGHMPRDTEHSHGPKYVTILDMDLLPISEGPMSAVKGNMLSSADFVGSRQC